RRGMRVPRSGMRANTNEGPCARDRTQGPEDTTRCSDPRPRRSMANRVRVSLGEPEAGADLVHTTLTGGRWTAVGRTGVDLESSYVSGHSVSSISCRIRNHRPQKWPGIGTKM